MNPEDKNLLERAIKLSEENNHILKKIERRARWAMIWGLAKFIIILAPIVLGYLYLEPLFREVAADYQDLRGLVGF